MNNDLIKFLYMPACFGVDCVGKSLIVPNLGELLENENNKSSTEKEADKASAEKDPSKKEDG